MYDGRVVVSVFGMWDGDPISSFLGLNAPCRRDELNKTLNGTDVHARVPHVVARPRHGAAE